MIKADEEEMKTVAIIPARWASSRFEGKPLALLAGKTIVQRVWERVAAMDCVEAAVVATDDERIASEVERFGGRYMMTESTHRSGTDRCAEVARRLASNGESYDVTVNVQGDEPFVETAQVAALVKAFEDRDVEIATLARKITREEDVENENVVKVVRDLKGDALYFSRQALPFRRGVERGKWLGGCDYLQHIGVYAFRSEVLVKVSELQQTKLEKAESLEQLRWIENGYKIRVALTEGENIGIDTPADLARAEMWLREHHA